MNDEVREILAIRYSGLGDLVMLLPALAGLKARHPKARITLLTDTAHRDFQRISGGLIDRTLTVDRRVLKREGRWAAIKEILAMIRAVRRDRYDRLYDFQSFGETATLSWLARAGEKSGAPKKPKYNYGYHRLVTRLREHHRSQLFQRIAGVDEALAQPRLQLDDEGSAYRDALLDRGDDRPVVGLNIGSTQESRRWHHERFAELARRLAPRYRVLLFIGPREKPFEPFFQGAEIVTDTTLSQLAGAIAACDLFVSNDTGPVHMAGALLIPTLTLFSTGDDFEVGALGPHKRFIKRTPINDITVDEVINLSGELAHPGKTQPS